MALIHEKIPAIIGEVKAVGKDHVNETQKYKFRAIDDVYNALNSVLAKHKVSIIPKYTLISNEVTTEVKKNEWNGKITEKTQTTRNVLLQGNYKITAEDGSYEEVTTFGEAIDFGDKAFNKAMSQALKYCLFQVFCIPTEEEKDTEHQSPEIPKKDIGKTEPKKEAVKESFTAEKVELITPEQVKAVHTLITKTKTDPEKVKEHYKVNSSKELTKKQAAELIDRLSKKAEEDLKHIPQVDDIAHTLNTENK